MTSADSVPGVQKPGFPKAVEAVTGFAPPSLKLLNLLDRKGLEAVL